MATGLSPKLPIRKDYQDGFALNKTYKSMIAQNLKHLVLTNPGERIMDPLFGVGIRSFLFEQNLPQTHGVISARIKNQVGKYMPFVSLISIEFPQVSTTRQEVEHNRHILRVVINYGIPAMNTQDRISLVTSAQNTTI